MTLHFNYHPHWSLGDNQSIRSSAPVVSRCLWPGNKTFLEVASMVVTWWIVVCSCSGSTIEFKHEPALSSSLSSCISFNKAADKTFIFLSLLFRAHPGIEQTNRRHRMHTQCPDLSPSDLGQIMVPCAVSHKLTFTGVMSTGRLTHPLCKH